MRSRSLVSAFSFVLIVPLLAAAQTATTTTVSGTVVDAQGAAVVAATVKLTDAATNTERTATTDSEGRYSFYAVSPGAFRLTVTAPGFKTLLVSEVLAEVSKVANVNVSMEVGEVAAVVQVVAGVESQLQTTDASVGSVFDTSRLKQLPNVNW
jgi:Carboxypeptidase regulatory-like domain